MVLSPPLSYLTSTGAKLALAYLKSVQQHASATVPYVLDAAELDELDAQLSQASLVDAVSKLSLTAT